MDQILFDFMMTLLFILFFSGIFVWAGTISICGYLGRKYDHILLKSPHFTPEEQVNYLEFPLYLHKTIIYMTYFTYPSIAKRRFKDIPAPKIELLPKILSHMIMTVALVSIPLLILFLIIAIYLYSQI